MDNLEELYNDIIMEHSMNSYNKKDLDNYDYCQMGHNPNCGDEIKIQIKLNNDIIEDMIKNLENTNYEVIINRKNAIIKGIQMLENNDILLVLGKGHETYQIIGKERLEFDDKQIVLEII